MGNEVFANGNEIACKSGDGKVIAAFPDVCLSPPSPPAGPIPVPYPNTSFSKDMKNGSKTVKINGKEVMLKNKSFYKTSPLGDEAATRSFGGSVIAHVITGKTYFAAWSMDVKFEGENVPRHIDLTTSNHASYPGSTPPIPNAEEQKKAEKAIKAGKCACCGGDKHSKGADMHRDEYYEDNINEAHKHDVKMIGHGVANAKKKLAAATASGDAGGIAAAGAALAAQQARVVAAGVKRDQRVKDMKDLMKRALERTGCTCPDPRPQIVPSPPCDVFYKRPPNGPEREQQNEKSEALWRNFRKRQQAKKLSVDRIPPLKNMEKGDAVMHLTPIAGGGCPVKEGNLTLKKDLCGPCQTLDKEFTDLQKLG
ncbi:MAG: DUF4150 domain-containing protein [Desulfobacterales bacterium]|nr:DUF4150 domain-containing protein [Desulfobacterales bacterium]